ncbi:hypothetical protein Dimus_028238 [Dionaea muscipula]
MAVARVKTSGSADLMKSEDGNDSVDTFIRQAVGKEPFLSFTRAGDSPVQWIQLLHALDQQDVPGWPLLSPVKVQMQKCDKCSREFCSTINHRRHTRLHRRSLNLDKDSAAKTRDCLQIYWEKLSTDEAVEVLSFKDVSLEEVTGSSILRALTSFIRKPGFTSLPHAYVKAGSALLDIIQGRPSRFPLTAQELFSILDDASEKTFLCAGTTESLQKFIFDGEAGKIGLEIRNLIACTSFLIEQKLVKAWLADKDAEALRCQKMLVEEEEAAQKRLAALMEKKRQKKLRQKEQKMKDQANGERVDLLDDITAITESVPSPPTPSPVDVSDSDSQTPPHLSQDSIPLPNEPDQGNVEEDVSNEAYPGSDGGYPDSGAYQNVDHRSTRQNGRRHMANYRWQGSRMQRPNGHVGPNHQVMKVVPAAQRHGSYRDSRIAAVGNVSKVWTPKPKLETEEENSKERFRGEPINLRDENKDSELLIGSITVTLGNQSNQRQQDGNHQAPDNGNIGLPSPKKDDQEKSAKPDKPEIGLGRSTVQLWRPVSRHGNGDILPVQNGMEEAKVDVLSCSNSAADLPHTCPEDGNDGDCTPSLVEECGPEEGFGFSSRAAEAFLAQRWKEAMASDHVKLVLLPDAEPPGFPESEDDSEVSPSSVLNQCSINLVNVENGTINSKLGAKPEKGSKVRYIPKQRCPS